MVGKINKAKQRNIKFLDYRVNFYVKTRNVYFKLKMSHFQGHFKNYLLQPIYKF